MATSFINFSNEHRQTVRDQNPGLHITEIAKILGAMWRSLTDEEKADYKY
jgi:hypothetical protein